MSEPTTKAGRAHVAAYRRYAARDRQFIVFPDEVAIIEAEARAAERDRIAALVEAAIPPSSMRGERYRGWTEHRAVAIAAIRGDEP